MLRFATIDLAAITAFVLAWFSYHVVVEWSPWAGSSLNRVMERYRRAWMREMLVRENRIVDTQQGLLLFDLAVRDRRRAVTAARRSE
jgi:uncharacterized membrane protein